VTTTPSKQSKNSAEANDSVGIGRHRRGFWVVAFAFLVVMALGTVPSPLYGLYRARDHFSLFMVTVAFAVYAIGVIGALLLGGHLSDLYGRRRLLLPSVGIAIASGGLPRVEEPRGPPRRPAHQRTLDRHRRVDGDRVPRRAARRWSA
jgi:predicted MFS family arabinose efflux permease